MIPKPIQRLIDAGRVTDVDVLHGLIDWPLSTACMVVQAVAGVKLRDREKIAQAGILDIEMSARSLDRQRRTVLTELSKYLVEVRSVRPATAAEAKFALKEGVQFAAPPDGISPMARGKLEIWRARAMRVSQVYAAERPPEASIWLALTPERDRVVLVSKL